MLSVYFPITIFWLLSPEDPRRQASAVPASLEFIATAISQTVAMLVYIACVGIIFAGYATVRAQRIAGSVAQAHRTAPVVRVTQISSCLSVIYLLGTLAYYLFNVTKTTDLSNTVLDSLEVVLPIVHIAIIVTALWASTGRRREKLRHILYHPALPGDTGPKPLREIMIFLQVLTVLTALSAILLNLNAASETATFFHPDVNEHSPALIILAGVVGVFLLAILPLLAFAVILVLYRLHMQPVISVSQAVWGSIGTGVLLYILTGYILDRLNVIETFFAYFIY